MLKTKCIDDIDNIDAVIMLLEILEIKTNNKVIMELQEEAAKKLKEILSKANNPDWLILLLLKAREKVQC
ncbi:MAG: hypothetical protein LWW94_08565 [Candidatus Desulfofervidaceae bacterium]|nr:hypothetical protein [Candidatus Desulfofervidaceae bacterium]